MDFNDTLEKLEDNPELAQRFEEAIKNEVEPSDLYGILVEGGVEAEAAEAAMAEYQRRRGLAISDEDVDEETLRKVAGGGCGTACTQADDCDKMFKDERQWGKERCTASHYCDEFYIGVCVTTQNVD